MNRKTVVVIILAAVFVLVGLTVSHFIRKHKIDYSLALSYATSGDHHGTWNVVSSAGFYTGAMFAADYESQTGERLPESIDTERNTYVVCYGFTLDELFYREGDKSGRFTSSAPYYYAKAVLRTASNKEANIYLIHEQVPIDRDPHSNTGHDTTIIK